MNYNSFKWIICLLLFAVNQTSAQFNRIDSTLKIGKAGYKVFCNNKSEVQNQLTVRPMGFESGAQPMTFFIKGQISKVEIDDFNNDGFPDLLICIFNGDHNVFGTVYVFMSAQNKSIVPAALPDVMLDGKLKDGYKGHDEFTLMEGSLMQQFPIYKPGDEPGKPTGGRRVIQYKVIGSEEAGYKFKVVRTYELK
jgi:hypothetical protein